MLLFSRVKLASPGLPGTEEMKAKPDQKWVQQNKCTGYNESAGVFEDWEFVVPPWARGS